MVITHVALQIIRLSEPLHKSEKDRPIFAHIISSKNVAQALYWQAVEG